jgi:hypothetical protein
MSTLKIELNGTLVTGRLDGTDNFSVTIRRSDEDGKLAKSFSSELTFYDDGYQILKSILIDDPNGFANEVNVTIYDDCCQEPVFDGVIKGDAIDWCEPGCWITANVVEKKDEINCIRNTIIWDNHNGFLSRSHPIIRYCIEIRPEFIQYILIYLLFIFNILIFNLMLPTLAAIFVIIGIIYLFCQIIVLICRFKIRFKILRWTIQIGPICNPPNCNTGFTNPVVALNQIFDALRDMNERIIPCGRFHPSPYIRDYVNNVCQKCGLTFQSSILNDPSSPYFNAVMMAAQIKKGRKKDSNDFTLIGDNKPVETLETLMNEYLKPVFNADFRISNGVLIFERKDFFQTTINWIDTIQLLEDGDIVDNQICFNWIDKERWAFGRFEYQSDAQDYIGNEAKVPRYNEIVDWNVPYNPAQTGSKEVMLPLSPARHRQDGIDTDVFTFFQTALGGVINAVFYGAFSTYDRAMLINQHSFFNYKFLIYNPSSDGEVQNYYSDSYIGGWWETSDDQRYNYPFWFVEQRQNNLYSLFHYIDDPRIPGTTKFDFEFTFLFNCSQYKSFDFVKSVKLVRGGQVMNGIVEELQVDFKNRTIQVKGIV